MPAPKPPAITGSRTSLQTYEYREIPRSAITNAPYNPRTITDVARGKLQQLLERHGLVGPVVWNERTGHCVGGHQRLSILDDLEGGPDYTLGVARLDVPLEREAEINIALNNEQLRGEFDQEKFFQLLQGEHAPSLEGMGFTRADLEMEFGPGPQLDALFGTPAALPELGPEVEDEDEATMVTAPSEDTDAEPSGGPDAEAAEGYLLVAFPTQHVKARFLMSLERPGDLRLMASDEFVSYLEAPHDHGTADVSVPGDSADGDHQRALQPAGDVGERAAEAAGGAAPARPRRTRRVE